MKNSVIQLSLIALACASNVALAATAPSHETDASFYSQLDELRSKNAILTEQLKNFDLQNKMSNPPPTPGAMSQPGQLGQPSMGQPGSSGQLPPSSARVEKIYGVSHKLTAVLFMPDGGHLHAHVGSEVPGVGQVKDISASGVVARGKKGDVTIPFMSNEDQ